MAQGLRLAPQTGDDMVVVDDLRAPGAEGTHARQLGDAIGAKEPFQAVVVEMHPETMTDQARRHAVENLVDGDGGVAGHRDGQLGEVGGAPNGQRLQNRDLGHDAGTAAGIVAIDDVRHEPAIIGQALEVPTAAASEGLIEPTLQVPMGGLDGAVLVRFAGNPN